MIQDLDVYAVVAKLKAAEGASLPAISFKIRNIEASPDPARLERIRQRTRARFCKQRAEVERELGRDLYQATQKTGNDGKGYYE
jgi:hypothetical protein